MQTVVAFIIAICAGLVTMLLTQSMGFASILFSLGALILTLLLFGLYQQVQVNSNEAKFDRLKETNLRSGKPSGSSQPSKLDFDTYKDLLAWERQKRASFAAFLVVFGFIASIIVAIAFEIMVGIAKYAVILVVIGFFGYFINAFSNDGLFSRSKVTKLVCMWQEEQDKNNMKKSRIRPPFDEEFPLSYTSKEEFSKKAEELIGRIKQYESHSGELR